jgi:hypothetical protein
MMIKQTSSFWNTLFFFRSRCFYLLSFSLQVAYFKNSFDQSSASTNNNNNNNSTKAPWIVCVCVCRRWKPRPNSSRLSCQSFVATILRTSNANIYTTLLRTTFRNLSASPFQNSALCTAPIGHAHVASSFHWTDLFMIPLICCLST